jgi:hypothetical protein
MVVEFKKIVAYVAMFVFFSFVVDATEKSEAEYLRGAHVYFDVQKTGGMLELTGKELGTEKLKVQIADSAFSSFKEYTSNNFHISLLGDVLRFQYRSEDDKKKMNLRVKKNGDVELEETDDTYTGWDEYETFGVKTSGTLENRGTQAFWFLVASANQIHNYGTIDSFSVQLFQNYLFNSGVMQFGVMPTGLTDLSTVHSVDTTARPSFKNYTIENYGTFRSRKV